MKSIDRIKVLLLFLSVTAGIVAALILLSLLSPSPAGATGLAQGGPATCLITDTLENLVGCIYDYMPRRYGIDGRNGFTAPTTTEMSQWRDVVGRMIRGECNINLSKVYTGDWVNDFTVTTFTDTQASHTYCVFMETGYNYYSSKERVKRGWGTFIVNQHPSRELSIQVPHPISDIGTAMEGVGIFKGTNSRSFLMAGTHPDANNITSTCQSTYPQADVAHNTRSMFQPTVERLLEFYDSTGGDFVAVQFHGMATSSCPGVDGYMTHGISTAPVLGNKILELKANLLRHNPTWTVTVPGDSPTCYLDGSDNVQGRLLNGVAAGEVCKTPALSYSGRFIHIEQKPDPNDTKKPGSFRDARNWVDAINDTWAFTVLGTVTCQATRPISDVEVYVWKRGKGSGFVGDVTDSSGTYRVTLEEGTYDLIFNPRCGSGCASKAYKGVSGPPDLTLNVVLSPGYTISGTVFATNGVTPVEGVSIYAFNHETADGFGLPLTEADGHYCIGLIAGTYDLGFTPPPCRGLGPRTVVTTVNQDMSLDIILPPGFTVAGCVTDGLGKPVPGVQIYANDPNIGGFGLAPTNESGCYTGTLPYAGSPPTGVYDVQFIPPPRPRLGSLTIIDVTSTTSGCPNTTLPITLPAGFTLSGRVTCNGKGIKNVYVYALPQGPQDPNNSLPGYSIFTVDDGSYGLPLVSGTYRLEFTPPLATGLNARAFTTTQILTDTVLDVNFCVCSGAWVTETVDGVGNVGNDGDTSLALAPTYPYTPHISYYSVSSQSVKHAWLSGAIWLSHTVWPRYVAGQISLALVPTYPYTPCIAYYDRAYWGVQFAYWDDTTWVSQVVEAGHFQGEGGVSLALAPVYPYTPHVSYDLAWNVDDLKYAYLSGTTWMSGTWVRTTVDSSGTVGSDNSLALEQTYPYTPHISYYDDYTNGDVKHAWLSSTTWLTETVDSEGSVGRWSTSLALDSDGDPHISYLDSTNLFSFDLKYAWRSGTTWLTETVDSEGDVGWFTSLALDGRGNPHISYYGRTPGGLKYARFDNRVWIVQTVDSGIDVGRHSSLALDPAGCPNISYYNAPHGELKYAHIPPRYLVYLPLVMRNYP